MTSILAFERANDTLRPGGLGSDAHGWRNALNAYGWGQDALTDPARMVFEDRGYRTFSGAVRAAVKAIARRGMPVGILGWAGGHAQVMTGYVVTVRIRACLTASRWCRSTCPTPSGATGS